MTNWMSMQMRGTQTKCSLPKPENHAIFTQLCRLRALRCLLATRFLFPIFGQQSRNFRAISDIVNFFGPVATFVTNDFCLGAVAPRGGRPRRIALYAAAMSPS